MEKDDILTFGKYEGKKFSETPISYQKWLRKQSWFKAPIEEPDTKILSWGNKPLRMFRKRGI